MPGIAHSTTDPSAVAVRRGLAIVLDWLADHQHIAVSRIDYAGSDGAELALRSGKHSVLAAAVTAAEALTDPHITVTEEPSRTGRWCRVTVTGWTGHDTGAPIELTVTGICFDQAALSLLASLGAPPVPDDRTWNTTAGHLRGLLPTAVDA